MTDPLVREVAARLAALAPAGAPVLVAVSGGPDSRALLEMLVQGRSVLARDLVIGHVDHGIAAESAAVAAQVAEVSRGHGVPYRVAQLALGGEASETTARRARRRALEAMADDAGAAVIALGHHADDQVETILMRLLRGSGPAGLAGMAATAGRYVRPLLDWPQATLAAWLTDQGLSAHQDPANHDPRHLRSWLRQELLPQLDRRLPEVRPRILAAGRQAAEARSAWAAVPELLPALALQHETEALSVAALPLWGYRSEVRRALLAALGRRLGVSIGARRAAAIERLLASGRSGRVVRVDPRLDVELSRDRLFLRRPTAATADEVPLPAEGTAALGPWRLACRPDQAAALARAEATTWFTPGALAARPWRPGDRIRPLGGSGSRAVGRMLREAGVPRGRRAAWPVIVGPVGGDATILWVPGICRASARTPAEGTEARRVDCTLA